MFRNLIVALGLLLTTTVPAQAQETMRVRVTYYVLRGVTASGGQTYYGVAACSRWIAFGTILRFSDGREVECLDRGSGINGENWVDIWVPSVEYGRVNVAQAYGNYATVEVVRYGYGR